MKRSALLTIGLLTALAGALTYHGLQAPDEIARRTPFRFKAVEAGNLDRDIEFLRTKLETRRAIGPDAALLASLYLTRAQATGEDLWFERAESEARRSLKAMPQANVVAQLVLAKIAESRHDFVRAIGLADAVLLTKADSSAARVVLVTSYLAIGELGKASALADELVELSPGLESYGLRALVMDAQGRSDESTSDFMRALEIEDVGEFRASARIRALFARSLMRRGDFAHAEDLLAESLRTIPGYHFAYDLLGELHARRGDLNEAARYYRLAFASSKQLIYLVHAARLAQMRGQSALARDIQDQAELLIRADLAENGFGHRLDLASVLLDRARPEDISEALSLALAEAQGRRSALVLGVLARAQTAAGLHAQARRTMRELLRSGIRDADYYRQAALAEAEVRNARASALYLDLAQRADPSQAARQRERGRDLPVSAPQ